MYYLTCLAISKACCFCSLKYNWNYGLNCFTVNLSRKFHKVNCKLNDNYFDLTLSSLFERKKTDKKEQHLIIGNMFVEDSIETKFMLLHIGCQIHLSVERIC